MRDPDGVRILHGFDNLPPREGFVAENGDLADFDLGSLHDVEHHFERGWRDAPQVGSHGGELMPVLGDQIFQYDGRVVSLRSGSYIDSTTNPTLRSLNRSRMSDVETDFAPSYLMSRITGRLVTLLRLLHRRARPSPIRA